MNMVNALEGGRDCPRMFHQSVQDCVENKIPLEKMAAHGISNTTFHGLPTGSHWDFHQPTKQNFNIKVSKWNRSICEYSMAQ